jgi:cytochrome oxidase Cu insertion factor (SCO1/SenC/PrrC family)
MIRSLCLWLLAPGLGLIAAGCYYSAKPSSPAVKSSAITIAAVGHPAPDIEGNDVNGNPMNLRDFRGKVVLLDFWATY